MARIENKMLFYFLTVLIQTNNVVLFLNGMKKITYFHYNNEKIFKSFFCVI